MWKNFQLSKFVNQENNFVIYEEFFDDCKNSLLEYNLSTVLNKTNK